ncbi:MAG: AAA family ATPase [Chloroflexota bacterium]|nr:AAA family ATPase [Chloroflexota bacterium]
MPKVALSADFLTAFAGIPRAQQKKVREFITRFEANPTAASINYEPIHDVRDDRVRTVRIDLAYRAIVVHPDQGDVYLLAWVDHHDKAMAWARNKRFEVNPVTGALQVIDTEELKEVQARTEERVETRELEDYGPFDTFSDDDLLRTGLPAPLLPAVRALRSPDELDGLESYLPEEAWEALYWVANLDYSIDQALAEVSTARQPEMVDVTDLETALQQPDSLRRFVMVESADELIDILNAPLEKWRVFLHPSQARLVRRHFNGPARVLGGAGTGKTVVAMHRARHLAGEVFTAPTERVLFTTYTRNLATNISENLQSLCGPEFKRIEVTNLHAWAVQLMRSQGVRIAIAKDEEVDRCWENAISAVGQDLWDQAFYQNEWKYVVQAQDISERSEYLRALRRGRRARLSRPQRAAVWQVFEEYRRQLDRLGKTEWIDLIRQTRLYLQGQGDILPYRAIVVDETQDLHPEELRLLRQMVPEGPNDLFFVGDAHQRIYGRPVVMSHLGINIRGRGRKLRINYRTTEEIRTWSIGVLSDAPVDDLDGGADSSAEYVSLMHGPKPTVRQFSSLDEEVTFLVGEIQALADFGPLEHICIVGRTHSQLMEDYLAVLREAGIDHLYLQADTPEYVSTGVRLATMHRVKGLEFPHVFVAGVNDGIVPLAWHTRTYDESEKTDSEIQERCLLHVASSRARETLTITSYGRPSRFVEGTRNA